MDPSGFDAQLTQLRTRLTAFERHLASGAPDGLTLGAEALEDAQRALEELQISDVELRQQNAALAAAQAALVAQRAEFQELFDLAPVGYLVTDSDAVVQLANRAAAALLGVHHETLVGKPLARFVAPDDLPALEDVRRRVRAHGEPRDVDLHLRPRERGLFPANLRLSMNPGPGAAGTLRWVLTDITERVTAVTAERSARERVAQAEKLESLGQLAGGVAHDFGNIVTGIALSAEVLLGRLVVDESAHRLGVEIQDAARRARSLIDGLLLFARSAPQTMEIVDVHRETTRVMRLLQRLLPTDIEVRAKVAPGLPPVALGADHIERILVNLAVNARDAMPRGGRLTITARHPTPDECVRHGVGAGAVALVVADSGTGMLPAVRARAFEPFFTTKPRGQGTGLGLSTIHGIVEPAGGVIDIESALGAGTSVRVFLPPASVPTSTPEPAGPRSPLTPGRILVVDDDGAVQRAVATLLRDDRHTVHDATDAAEALATLADPARPIDLLVTDLVMPGLGGQDLARHLWASRPGIPVLFMSGDAQAESVLSTDAGARTGFLRKPFSAVAFRQLVGELLAP